MDQSLAALAGPLATDVAVNEELSWDDVQALAYVFANTHHGLAATTCRALWLMVVVHPFEVLRQGLAFWLTAGAGVSGVARLFGHSL